MATQTINSTIRPRGGNEALNDYDLRLSVCPSVANRENMQHYDVITNPRWRTAVNMIIVMLEYLSEKWSDYDEIWYSGSDSDRGNMIQPKFIYIF